MKINVNYLENEIDIVPDCVFAIEIENKKYFYRLTHELYNIYQGIVSNEITLYDDGNQEITGTNKIKIFINYFDFQLDSKKYINDISKYIENNISEENKMKLINEYKKIISLYKRALNEIDLPICINPDFDVESLTKLLKIKLEMKNEILDNLLLIIDLENVLNRKNILFFINLKQYLTNDELLELYKYSIYRQISIVLIDSQNYGTSLKYERKLIIDSELDEFMLQS